MNKDQTIQRLVASLPMERYAWSLVDNWDADRCAVGIARKDRPRQLVYISTHGKEPGRYDYQCEMPTGPRDEDHATIRSGENVDFHTLSTVIHGHLTLNP